MPPSISATASSRCARFAPSLPDAVVIDLSRMPSHGREVAQALRSAKGTRHLPIVFVDGEPEKVKRTKQLLPDAIYTTWGRIKTALPKAIAKPPANPVVPDHNAAWGKPTVDKLGVKPGFKVALLGSPKGFADTLKPWPAKVTFTARPEPDADLFLCFAQDRSRAARAPAQRRADRRAPDAVAVVAEEGLGREVRPRRQHRPRHRPRAGWVDFKVCSVDATWSGLAFKRRK